MDSFAAITGSSFILAVTEFGLELIDVECKVLSLHVLWVRYLFEHADLPGLFRVFLALSVTRFGLLKIGIVSTTCRKYRSILSNVKSSLRFTLRIQCRHCPRDHFSIYGWLVVSSVSCPLRMSLCFLRSSGSGNFCVLLGEPGGRLDWLLLPV